MASVIDRTDVMMGTFLGVLAGALFASGHWIAGLAVLAFVVIGSES